MQFPLAVATSRPAAPVFQEKPNPEQFPSRPGLPSAVLWGAPWDGGKLSVPNLFRMLTPGESIPDLDLTHKTIQSLPNAPKAIKNKQVEGRWGRKSGA